MSLKLEKIASVEELSESEREKYEFVYDLEVDNPYHCFFSNDILIHNSLFFSYKSILESCNYQGNYIDFILKLEEVKLENYVKTALEHWAARYGVENKHNFSLEKIANMGLFLEQKKSYFLDLEWEDGKSAKHKPPYIVGLDVIRSSASPFLRSEFMRIINYLIEHPTDFKHNEILKIIKDMKRDFMGSDIEKLCIQTSVKQYGNYVIDDKNAMRWKKGAPAAVKAAIAHNYLLYHNQDHLGKYEYIRPTDKVKLYYTKNNKIPIFGFLKDKYPIEIAMEHVPIDYDKQFDKTLLSLMNRINKVLNIPNFDKTLTLIKSLF